MNYKIRVLFIILFIISCKEKNNDKIQSINTEIIKFQSLRDRLSFNNENKIKSYYGGCIGVCITKYLNNRILTMGHQENGENSIPIYKYKAEILKDSNSKVKSKILEYRDLTKEEEKEFEMFDKSINNIDHKTFQRKGIYSGEKKELIKKYLPEGITINLVTEIKLNNDKLVDFVIIYSFPVDITDDGVDWQTGIAIILSENENYFLQYDDSKFAHDLFKIIIDIQIVKFFGKNNQILITHIDHGKRLQSSFTLLWFE